MGVGLRKSAYFNITMITSLPRTWGGPAPVASGAGGCAPRPPPSTGPRPRQQALTVVRGARPPFTLVSREKCQCIKLISCYVQTAKHIGTDLQWVISNFRSINFTVGRRYRPLSIGTGTYLIYYNEVVLYLYTNLAVCSRHGTTPFLSNSSQPPLRVDEVSTRLQSAVFIVSEKTKQIIN